MGTLAARRRRFRRWSAIITLIAAGAIAGLGAIVFAIVFGYSSSETLLVPTFLGAGAILILLLIPLLVERERISSLAKAAERSESVRAVVENPAPTSLESIDPKRLDFYQRSRLVLAGTLVGGSIASILASNEAYHVNWRKVDGKVEYGSFWVGGNPLIWRIAAGALVVIAAWQIISTIRERRSQKRLRHLREESAGLPDEDAIMILKRRSG